MGGCTGKSKSKIMSGANQKQVNSDIKEVLDFTPLQGFGLQRMSAKKHIDIDFERLKKYNEKKKEPSQGIHKNSPYPIIKEQSTCYKQNQTATEHNDASRGNNHDKISQIVSKQVRIQEQPEEI